MESRKLFTPILYVLNMKLDFWKLFEKLSEPTFDSTLPLESATFGYFTWLNEYSILAPTRHKLGKVVPLHSLKVFAMAFLAIMAPIIKHSFQKMQVIKTNMHCWILNNTVSFHQDLQKYLHAGRIIEKAILDSTGMAFPKQLHLTFRKILHLPR